MTSAVGENNWLRLPRHGRFERPGHLALWVGGLLRRRAEHRPFDSRTAEYFEREKRTAAGAWEYYERFLPRSGRRPLKVLDLGSGPGGRTSGHASKTDARFFCVDLDLALLQSAARGVHDREDRTYLTQSDAMKLPFADGAFDVCLCENAMEHFARPDLAVRELARVLRPGGHLFLMFPAWRGPFSGHLTYFTRLPWLHLLPTSLVVRLLVAIQFPRWTRGSGAWRDSADAMLRNLASHLNGWSVTQILTAARQCVDLKFVDGYALGEWSISRLLRFVPSLGEFFTSFIYVVYRKADVAAASTAPAVTGYNDILRQMIRVYLRRPAR